MKTFTKSEIDIFFLDEFIQLGFSYIFVVTREMLLSKLMSGELKVNL